MNALTVTTLVLWTFRPFATIQDAQFFMDGLPDTANASLQYGPVQTKKERVANQRILDHGQAVMAAKHAEMELCHKMAASPEWTVSKNSLRPLHSRYAHWEQNGGNPELYHVECEPEYMISETATIVTNSYSSRWLVVYRAPKNVIATASSTQPTH